MDGKWQLGNDTAADIVTGEVQVGDEGPAQLAMTISKYKLVAAPRDEIEEKIDPLIVAGWQPLGAPFILPAKPEDLTFQERWSIRPWSFQPRIASMENSSDSSRDGLSRRKFIFLSALAAGGMAAGGCAAPGPGSPGFRQRKTQHCTSFRL